MTWRGVRDRAFKLSQNMSPWGIEPGTPGWVDARARWRAMTESPEWKRKKSKLDRARLIAQWRPKT